MRKKEEIQSTLNRIRGIISHDANVCRSVLRWVLESSDTFILDEEDYDEEFNIPIFFEEKNSQ